MFLLLDVYVSSSFGRSGTTWFKCSSLRASLLTDSRVVCANREIKLDVTWSYIKLQPAKMTSQFLFFSSNPLLTHTHKNTKMSPTIRRKYKYFHSTVQRAINTTAKVSFLPVDIRPRNVKLNLSIVRLRSGKTMRRKTYENKDVIRNKNLPTVFANSFNHNRARPHKTECT